MRRRTPKRAKRDREAAKWRKAQIAKVGRCEFCLKPRNPDDLTVHEIGLARGGNRVHSQDKAFSTLILCKIGCHQLLQKIERGVLRALAIELGRHDDTPRYPPEAPKPSMTDAERSAYLMALKWKAPLHLGHTASRLSRSPLLISPIDRVADRVAHFDNDDRCPYCNRFYRNGAALRLHVIERHLEEAS